MFLTYGGGGGGGGGGGRGFFPPLANILGDCSTIHSPPAFFIFILKVEINSCTLIPLFRQGQFTVAHRAETTVAEFSLTSSV